MFPVPCEPTPIDPITILSLGGVTPFIPKADDGMMFGMIIAPATAESEFRRKIRRELLLSMLVSLEPPPHPSEGRVRDQLLIVFIS